MNKLHLIVRNQFPEFVREDYPVFVEFVKAYYRWLDLQSAGKIEDLIDLDKTSEEFVQYFRSELDTLGLFNTAVPFNKLYLQKIKQIYATKGSEQALVNILRLVYQAEAEITYPSENILRASDGKWKQDNFITVERAVGTLPTFIESFYIDRNFAKIRVPVTNFIITSPTTVRLYYKQTAGISLQLEQLITINDSNGNYAYTGRIVKSPSYLEIISGGKAWQLGQIVTVPGTNADTVARISEIDPDGKALRVEIINHGYEHTENQAITVSPYPNKPIVSTYNLTSELISVTPIAYHYTLDVFDYIDGESEQTVGTIGSNTVIDVSSVAIEPEPSTQTDITIEQWLESRTTFKYVFDSVTSGRGTWSDDSGQISNQTIRLQDNFYYQQFSYVVKSSVNNSYYQNALKNLNPAGMKPFTTYNLSQEIEVIPFAETSFPFLRLDLLDVATLSDTRYKHPVKIRYDIANATEDFTFVLNKYLEDSATISSPDTAITGTATYDAQMYFAEEYVVTEKTLTIGV